jgi:8-oxo-dGTP pyrophosphatase MutT (NUDIX family)
MYKIFFEDRYIFLTDKKDNYLAEDSINFNYTNPLDLKTRVKEFESNKKIKILQVFFPDIDELFSIFSSFFRIIHAAGGLVINPKNEVLLIQRLGRWDLPKGKVEKEEKHTHCALREVSEECGISGQKIIKQLPDSFHTYYIGSHHVMKQTHWYEMSYHGTEELIPQVEEYITAVKWFPISHVDDILKNTYKSLFDLFNYLKNNKIKI